MIKAHKYFDFTFPQLNLFVLDQLDTNAYTNDSKFALRCSYHYLNWTVHNHENIFLAVPIFAKNLEPFISS